MTTILNFLTGWLEGPVMFAQDLGWFFFAAFGPALLLVGIVQGYAPWHIGKLNRASQISFVVLWVSLLVVYDFNPSWQKWLMIISVICWVVVVVKLARILYLMFRDDGKDDLAEAA